MTLMVATHGPSRHLPRLSVPDNASFFATLVFNAATSNGPQTFVLGKMDENVEWNVWPHPLATPTAGRAGPHFSLNDVMPTNR